MMTKATLDTQNPEIKRNYISQVLEQLTLDYQNTKQERKEIAALYHVRLISCDYKICAKTGKSSFSLLRAPC
jgi:hypothetical protein